MQKNNPLFDEFAKWMTTATGLAQTAGEEAKSVMRAQSDKWIADMDLVRREDLDALTARVAKLEALLADKKPTKAEKPKAATKKAAASPAKGSPLRKAKKKS